jgi:hypothetical protein
MPLMPTTRLASAAEAPRFTARRGTTGMTAPWPTENRKVGRYTLAISDRRLKSAELSTAPSAAT